MRGYRRRPQRCFIHRRGVTLIELIVTITLLGIGLVGVSSMFIIGYRNQVHSHFTSVGTDLATRKVERMKAAGFNSIDSVNFPSPFAIAELPSGQGTIAWEPYPDVSSTNQYLVTITVTWGGGNGIEGETRLCSVISNHG